LLPDAVAGFVRTLRSPTLATGSFSSECHFEIPKDIEERLSGAGYAGRTRRRD